MRRLLHLLPVALALAIAVLAGCSGQAAENGAPPPPEVSVAAVPVKSVSQWDEFSGRVEAIEHVDLRPRVSGYIDRVAYTEGQEVKKGETIARLIPSSRREQA